MERIQPCNPYTGRPAGTELLRLPDGRSTLKIYFVDIPGRTPAGRLEWDLYGLPRADVARHLVTIGVDGIGFVTAFPHITKIFRFGPNPEILLYVRAYRTEDFGEIPLQREDGTCEFACLAEAIIAAGEYRFWATARSVEEYLDRWCDWSEATIVDHAKLARYYSPSG